MTDIAMIGERDSVLLARAGGMYAYAADDPQTAGKLIVKLANEGVRVIFMTEQLYEDCEAVVSKYRTQAFPAIIPIPSSHGSKGVGRKSLHANVERAIGVDILFSEDSKK